MEYRVLARKYRPTTFADLIGQEAMVRTLSNAIKAGRVAHAFLLTGIRGVGKTTTARIIARALNCEQGPTINPCGVCTHCTMIAEDRHMDVIEMDAASHTGVGDIRELIDTVRYLPTSARYKIYIIDEVHMLSTSAFNALLKTLEEPPPHVKFVFATTEARKIPVTILSRCQRFDLKRVPVDALAGHLKKIVTEGEKLAITTDPEAYTILASAAEGSVRDALSLLDQTIARAGEASAAGNITAAFVRQMLGHTGNMAIFDLFNALLKGDIVAALAELRRQYQNGADPLIIVQDALETTHLVTRVKVSPAVLEDPTISEYDREMSKAMAEKLSMPVIARLWQMLLKGLGEVRAAPSPVMALEMLLVRIAYAARLPTPAEAIRTFPSPSERGKGEGGAASATLNMSQRPHPAPLPEGESVQTFPQAVALFERHREALLYTHLKQDVRLVAFAPGQMTLKLTAPLPRDFAPRVAQCLMQWTGQPWKIILSEEEGTPSLREQEAMRKEKQLQEISAHPLVAGVLDQFPGAKIVNVKENA